MKGTAAKPVEPKLEQPKAPEAKAAARPSASEAKPLARVPVPETRAAPRQPPPEAKPPVKAPEGPPAAKPSLPRPSGAPSGVTPPPLTDEQRKAVDDALTLAQLFQARGDDERARREYRKVLDIDPTNVEAKQGLLLVEQAPKGSQ
jgi:hypothetical protein